MKRLNALGLLASLYAAGLSAQAAGVGQAARPGTVRPTPVIASDTEPTPKDVRGLDAYYLSLGLGAGTLGLSGKAEVAIFSGRWGLAFRLTEVTEFELFGPAPALTAGDIGGLLVRELPRDVMLGIGLAHARGVERGRRIPGTGGFLSGADHERIEWTAVGVPFKVEIAFHGHFPLGLGVETFGNVNGHRSFVGFVLQLHLGRFRP